MMPGGPRTAARALFCAVAALLSWPAWAAPDGPVGHSLTGQSVVTMEMVATIVAGFVTLYVYRINRRLRRSLAELEQAHEELAHAARHDSLTGLPDRMLFVDRVGQSLALARRQGTRLALMYIDLDEFKNVNDSHGHATGDEVLRQAARRMESAVRESDTVGRIGGDEFVVLLQDVRGEEAALVVAEKLRLAMGSPFGVDSGELRISASIGVALYPNSGEDEIELARNADGAMYEAKRGGGDRVVLHRPEAAADGPVAKEKTA